MVAACHGGRADTIDHNQYLAYICLYCPRNITTPTRISQVPYVPWRRHSFHPHLRGTPPGPLHVSPTVNIFLPHAHQPLWKGITTFYVWTGQVRNSYLLILDLTHRWHTQVKTLCVKLTPDGFVNRKSRKPSRTSTGDRLGAFRGLMFYLIDSATLQPSSSSGSNSQVSEPLHKWHSFCNCKSW